MAEHDQQQNEQLEPLLRHIRAATETLVARPDDRDLSIALVALLRAIIANGELILLVRETPAVEATSANVRSAFEAWLDIRFILAAGDARSNAIRHIVFGLLEFRDYLADAGVDAEDVAAIDAKLAEYRLRTPGIVADQEARFGKRRPLYWSGQSRMAMLDVVDNGKPELMRLTRVYRMLSWDAHHVLGSTLDVEPLDDGALRFRPRISQVEMANFSSACVEQLLGDAWIAVSNALGLKQLPGPE